MLKKIINRLYSFIMEEEVLPLHQFIIGTTLFNVFTLSKDSFVIHNEILKTLLIHDYPIYYLNNIIELELYLEEIVENLDVVFIITYSF